MRPMQLKWMILPPIFVAAFTAYGIAKAQITPASATAITVPITGGGTDPLGRSYTFSGNVSVAVSDSGLAPIQLVPDDSGIVIESIGGATGGSLVRVPVNTPLTFTGRGFGAGIGKIWLGSTYATVTSWTDTKIVIAGVPSPSYPHRQMIGLWHASKGWGGNAWLGPYVMPAGGA
jgi:hypothetical protein